MTRRLLIGMLTISLIVGGLPIAHAADCNEHTVAAVRIDPGHDHATMHDHHMATGGVAVAAVEIDHDASLEKASHRSDGPATPCKCLNCSSLCAAYVAPLSQVVARVSRATAIVYALRNSAQPGASVSIDPGIPISAT